MQKRSVYDLTQNPFALIGKQWALITAEADGRINAMTASWGGVGILWNKPVAFLFVRPQRFTRELIDRSERLSVCFLPEQYRSQLAYCGSHSGRDEEKLTACGLTPSHLDGVPAIGESELTLVCRKLMRQPIDPAAFCDPAIDPAHYPQQDYHLLYVAEIEQAYQA